MEDTRTMLQPVTVDGAGGVRVEVALLGGREEVGLADAIPIGKVLDTVGKIAEPIGKALGAAKAKKATVELGVEFGLDNGQLVALIVKGSAKANLKISLEWS